MTNSWALAYFNPRPHTGATAVLPLTHENTLYFNPRPHTGATCRSCTLCVPEAIFQSTPPYGGDAADNTHTDTTPNFNPRPHTGATGTACKADTYVGISIHAPIRGRLEALGDKDASQEFQSTPPYGGDLRTARTHEPWPDFNPRPHTGATRDRQGLDGGRKISIHAPIRGRPATSAASALAHLISIHAPIRGRLGPDERIVLVYRFQSTPPYGGDRCNHGW